MRIFNEEELNNFFAKFDFDVRKSNDARWIDQKCTIDVLSLVSDCILECLKEDDRKEFTASEIMKFDYTIKNVQDIFSKPNPKNKSNNEYDKFFGQPIKLLSYSKVLNCSVRANRNYYTIKDKELLEYISSRERNAFNFLCCYIEKVLKDSDIFYLFESFFSFQNSDSFKELKEGFSSFTKRYTPINGDTECNRIFIKVLNPLAYKRHLLGTVRGRLSKNIITLDMIVYNQSNWRDINSLKPKNIPRNEYEKQGNISENKLFLYKINKAKKILREYNECYRSGKSEYYEKNESESLATQMHHIFPVASYPEIADFIENIIALTPNQHLLNAHPNNNTYLIDKNYQYFLLVAKSGSIEENILNKELPTIYTFQDFIHVLNVGLDTNEFEEIEDMNFDQIVRTIDFYYGSGRVNPNV